MYFFSFYLSEETITKGSVYVDLKYDGFIPFKKTLNLCDLAKSSGLSCPIPQTTESLTISDTVPNVGVRGRQVKKLGYVQCMLKIT